MPGNMQYPLTLVAAFAALGVASPFAPVKQAFTVNQVEAASAPKVAPAISMLQTYAKYGATAPQVVQLAAAAAQSGTVQAIPESYDVAYLSPVTVGGKTMNLNFDTGSADLWVFSTLLPSNNQTGHDVYDVSHGTRLSGATWSIQYGDGSGAAGVVYADKVVVGSVTATSQAVEAATSVSSSFTDSTNSDGLMGLAFSNINTVRPTSQTTFFDTVKSTLKQSLFTVDLKKGGPGTYDFGFIDSSKYTGDITYVNANSASGFWQFTPSGYAIGTGALVSTSWTAIADTGTSLLYLPKAIVTEYYNKVTGSSISSDYGGYVFPCSSVLPTFTVNIGGATFTVPGTYLNYAQISSTTCFGGLQADTGIGFSIFGDMWLKSQFVVFSTVNSQAQLGFAAQSDLPGVSDSFEAWYLDCDGTTDVVDNSS